MSSHLLFRPRQAPDFGQGSIPRLLAQMAIPAAAAQLVQLLYSVVDRIYLGQLPGTAHAALTGLGLSFPLISFIAALTALCASGAAPLTTLYRGRGDKDHAERILGNACTLLTLCALGCMICSCIWLRPLLVFCGASTSSLPYAQEYLLYYLPGTWCSMLGTGLLLCLNAMGLAGTAMLIAASGAVANLILDPLFIFYFDLGIKGAAIASVLAQSLVFALAAWVYKAGSLPLTIRRSCLMLKPPVIREILALGLSGFVMQGTNAAVQLACNITLRRLGGDLYIGIMTILMSVRDLLSLPLISLTHSAQPLIAFNCGAQLWARVRRTVNFTTLVGVVYLTAAWALVLLFPEALLRLFGSTGTELTEGLHALHLYFFGFCFMALHSAGQSTFVGLNQPKPAIFFSLFRKIGVVVPLTLILPYCWDLGSDGVFIAEPVSNVLSGVLCYACMRRCLRRMTPAQAQ